MTLEHRYCLFGSRPVKAVHGPDGGFGVYAFNKYTGAFELDMSYLSRIYFDYHGDETDLTILTKEEFDDYVLKLREKLGFDVSEK